MIEWVLGTSDKLSRTMVADTEPKTYGSMPVRRFRSVTTRVVVMQMSATTGDMNTRSNIHLESRGQPASYHDWAHTEIFSGARMLERMLDEFLRNQNIMSTVSRKEQDAPFDDRVYCATFISELTLLRRRIPSTAPYLTCWDTPHMLKGEGTDRKWACSLLSVESKYCLVTKSSLENHIYHDKQDTLSYCRYQISAGIKLRDKDASHTFENAEDVNAGMALDLVSLKLKRRWN